MEEILDQIKTQLNLALKESKERKVSILRFLLASLHNEEIAKQGPLLEEETLAIIKRLVKKSEESIEAFKKGERQDLVQKEEEEKAILQTFLPEPLSQEQIRKVVEEILSSGTKDFGQVMGETMGKVKGQADGALVARIVKEEMGKQRND